MNLNNQDELMAEFKRWLVTVDDEKEFDFYNNEDCDFAQFLKTFYGEYLHKDVSVGGTTFRIGNSIYDLPGEFKFAVIQCEILFKAKELKKFLNL